MTHSIAFTYVVDTLAACAMPLLALSLVQWKMIGGLQNQLTSEKEQNRTNEQKFNDLLRLYLAMLWHAVYNGHLSVRYKKERDESREELLNVERQLDAERARSTFRSFLKDLFNRVLPIPARAG